MRKVINYKTLDTCVFLFGRYNKKLCEGEANMISHDYERIRIKEKKNLRENKEQILKRKKQEDNLQLTKARTAYNMEAKNKYDIGLMNREKEYRKTLDLLEGYQWNYLTGESNPYDNIEQLVQGYSDYFLIFGESMSALALRDFRNSIEKTIRTSRRKQTMPDSSEQIKEYQQDTAILDFCIAYDKELSLYGLDIGMTGTLINFLIDENTPIRNVENLVNVKTKVKSLLDSSKSNASKQ